MGRAQAQHLAGISAATRTEFHLHCPLFCYGRSSHVSPQLARLVLVTFLRMQLLEDATETPIKTTQVETVD